MLATLIGIAVMLVLNIIAFSFGYGKLTQTVNGLANDVSHLREDTKRLFEKIDELVERISKMEGKLGK